MSVEVLFEATEARLPDPAFSRARTVAAVLRESYGSAADDQHEERALLFTWREGAAPPAEGALCGRCGARPAPVCLCGAAFDGAHPSAAHGCGRRNLDWREDVVRGGPPAARRALAGARARWPRGVETRCFASEYDMVLGFGLAVRRLDPDILVGYEVQRASLGLLFERALRMPRPEGAAELSLAQLLSRTPARAPPAAHLNDAWGEKTGSDLHVAGRVVLNLWREMRAEVKLADYSRPNVAQHVLCERTPRVAPSTLWRWHQDPRRRHRAARHVLQGALCNLRLMERIDLLGTSAEMARIIGIDLTSVRTRGSQYRVEAVMCRVLKRLNYAVVSPSRRQVAGQPGLEVIPLVMEPRSRFYEDPVVVLDFQSLYPSIICAYNLCFSTCLGRLDPAAAQATHAAPRPLMRGSLGFSAFAPAHAREGLRFARAEDGGGRVFVAPTGAVFCSKAARVGVLPRMLSEILMTRFMCKRALKEARRRGQPALERVHFARQFALKMIANVTYGYTSASFSGRMPMAELADAIVQCGRRTLENAMRLVERTARWRAEVVYGDTDSMFVLLRGRSRAQAFAIGEEIARAVTASNPPGVELKFEKVYHPCILPSKKRYVGHMWESPADAAPKLEAKGIEIVRRDQCALTQRLQERCLETLFATRDASLVKAYLLRQLTKVLRGTVRVGDFVLAKEVRLGTYRNEASVPPQAVVAQRRMQMDPRAEPRHKERVPFVVVCGVPGSRLRENVVSPEELFLRGATHRINFAYYIKKHVLPALDRLLSLLGIDVAAWYQDMPKPRLAHSHRAALTGAPAAAAAAAAAPTMMRFVRGDRCRFCAEFCQRFICDSCARERGRALLIAGTMLREAQRRMQMLELLCGQCMHEHGLQTGRCGGPAVAEIEDCEAIDCAVYYDRHAAGLAVADFQRVLTVLDDGCSSGDEDAGGGAGGGAGKLGCG